MTDTKMIYNYLEEQGIKHSNLGYRYLTTSILLGLNDSSACLKITDLYQKVADFHHVKASDVERTIRYSLISSKMTNKEFISRAVDELNLAQNSTATKDNYRIELMLPHTVSKSFSEAHI